MNEGFLGKFSFGGERAATDDHPVILHALPLDPSVTSKLEVGTLLRRVPVTEAVPAVEAITETATATKGAGNTGVTAATVTAATFKAAVSNVAGTYAFSYDGTAWKLSGLSVGLDTYGVTVTGTPASGDTVSVVFTAAVAAKEAGSKTVDSLWKPYLSTDSAVTPAAVVDMPCDPAGSHGGKSVIAVVHGTVKTRLLTTGDGKAATGIQLAQLMENGVFAV